MQFHPEKCRIPDEPNRPFISSEEIWDYIDQGRRPRTETPHLWQPYCAVCSLVCGQLLRQQLRLLWFPLVEQGTNPHHFDR